MLQDLSVKDFIDELSSKSPAPGGGSVAALSASLASSLVSMVLNLTIGKKIYENYTEEEKFKIKEVLEKVQVVKDDFLEFMEEDTRAFLQVMKAFKLPKNTEEEIKIRKEKIQQSYMKALEVPLNVAKGSYDLYEYISIAATLGNPNAVSDAAVAASMTQSAIEGAVLNVKINLSSIKDEVYKNGIEEQCNLLIEEGAKKKKEIMDVVNKAL